MIRVASYNIRKSVGTDWQRQPERVLSVINEIDADVVALQEVDRRFGERTTSLSPELVAEKTPYRALTFGVRKGSIGWHGNTILVRKEFEVLSQMALELPALEPRGAVMADISTGSEKLRVVGMHLGLIGLWRKRQALAVLDQLEKLELRIPTVIMGDLNEWTVEGGCLAHFAHEHHVAIPGPSFHSHMPLIAFDRIITSRDIAVAHTGVHKSISARVASDHLPVWAMLKVAGFP
jgi:endonuclease/exonuclease/phosphatase family metal-dependent hydrolase